MKKLIGFLLAAILTAFAALNVAPMLYARHASEQYLRQGESQFSDGDIEKGIENLRLSIHVAEDSPPMLRSKALNEIPDILLKAANAYPLRFDEMSTFAEQNDIPFTCVTRLGMFSSLLENTLSTFKQGTTGAETAVKIKKIEENLTAASKLAAGCEIDPEDEARLTTYKRAYEKLSSKPFVEQPVSMTYNSDEPPIPMVKTPRAPTITSSILDIPRSITSSINRFIESKLHKSPAQPAAPQAAAPPATVSPAAVPPQQKPAERQLPAWPEGIKKSLEKIGVKPIKIKAPGDRALHLSVQTSSEGAALVDELKAIFEVVERNVKENGMIDKIISLKIDVLDDKGGKKAGWTITLSDYRLYRMGEMPGEEFTKRMIRD